jgi:hypothetical protein
MSEFMNNIENEKTEKLNSRIEKLENENDYLKYYLLNSGKKYSTLLKNIKKLLKILNKSTTLKRKILLILKTIYKHCQVKCLLILTRPTKRMFL